MNKSYDFYMCRSLVIASAASMSNKAVPYKIMCRICAGDRTYDANHVCMAIDPVAMTATPYIDAQTGTGKQIIREQSWIQRIFGQ